MPRTRKFKTVYPKVKGAASPNELKEPVTAKHRAAVAASCRFLGKDFSEGETICYDGMVWECAAGQWVKTSTKCES